MSYEAKTITAQNTFTDWIAVGPEGSLTITGTFVATVTLQHKQLGTGTVTDVHTFTDSTISELNGAGEMYRLGVKTGGFTSGTAYVTLKGCVDCLKTRADVFARFPELAGTVESSWTDEEGVEHVDELPRLVKHHYLGCKSFEAR